MNPYARYRMLQPSATHMRRATCAEVDCGPYLHGWRVPVAAVDERTHADLTAWGYRFTRVELGEGEGYLEFEAGQTCFNQLHPDRAHRVLIGRDPLWRRDGYVHTTADSWIDDMATNQDRLRTIIERYG